MDYIKIRFVENPESAESEFRRTIDEMLRVANPRFCLSRHRWRPQVDIRETADEVIVVTEIAGVKREAIQLEVAPGSVKISGIREGGQQTGDSRYRLAEIPCGYFERTLALPALIDTDRTTALYRDGLLEVRLAKSPLNRMHRISVQGG